MQRTKRTRTDRTQVQRVIVLKKGSIVSESMYIGDSDAHDQPAGAQSSPVLEDGDAPPATSTMTIFLLFYCFIAITSDQESAFQCFKSIRT